MNKQEKFISRANHVHDYYYDYSLVSYINTKTKVLIVCPHHGTFLQSPNNHLNGAGCPTCGKTKQGKRYNTEKFVNKAKQIHGDLYDYSKTVFQSYDQYVNISCPIHGDFFQRAVNHLQGYRCHLCSITNRTTSTDDFIQKAITVHGDWYDYQNTNYVRVDVPIIIECKLHGCFEQKPNSHLSGCGCPVCGIIQSSENATLNTNMFVTRAKQLHGDLYDYSNVSYVNTKSKVQINCPVHGPFFQQPNMHLQGQRCPRCRGHISVMETEWLDLMGVPNDSEHRQVYLQLSNGDNIRVDGKVGNTIYEFWGDFWHGNPNIFEDQQLNPVTKTTYQQLYQQTINKRNKIIQDGYELIDVWESDWVAFLKEND